MMMLTNNKQNQLMNVFRILSRKGLFRKPDHLEPPVVDPPPQPAPVNDSIEALIELRSHHHQRTNSHQLTIERFTNILGQPFFLYSYLFLAVVWISVNSILHLFNRQPFDEPPFFWLQGLVSFFSLLLTTMILITQNRLAQVNARQAQLDIHINLLSERKLAKLISLVEELRHDLPLVHNRVDTEAATMSQSINPIAVLTALEEAIQEETSSNFTKIL